jgi:hypothetical protein
LCVVAGRSAYNDGLVGSTNPAGVDSYNYGLVGGDPGWVDSYNQGEVGDNSSAGERATSNPSGFGGFGQGSKPPALHTEYAEGSQSSPKAYGTQDIVFYLQRADGGDPLGEREEVDANDNLFSGMGDQHNDIGQAGDTWQGSTIGEPVPGDGGNVWSGGQTAPGQIATGFSAPPSRLAGQGALLGVISNLHNSRDIDIDMGETTQNGVIFDSEGRLIVNAIGSRFDLDKDTILASTAASEKMFAKMMNNAFSPDEQLDGPRTPAQIRKALSRPSVSDLSVQLARETGGVRRTEDLVTLVNEGTIGLSSQKTRAAQSRLARRGQNSKAFRRDR